jgi:hypothetical protein
VKSFLRKRRRILAKKNLIRNETGFEVSCTLLLTISLCPYRPLFSLFEINKKEKRVTNSRSLTILAHLPKAPIFT